MLEDFTEEITAEQIAAHFSAMDDSVNLINDTVADDTSNRHYQAVQEWIDDGNTPEPADALPEETWFDKRVKSVDEGGYGTVLEQLEMLGEQGIQAFQGHAAAVKQRYPKD